MITVEPFAKLDAVCSGCGRAASAVRVAGRRFSAILCPSCLADLHRLTAEAPSSMEDVAARFRLATDRRPCPNR